MTQNCVHVPDCVLNEQTALSKYENTRRLLRVARAIATGIPTALPLEAEPCGTQSRADLDVKADHSLSKTFRKIDSFIVAKMSVDVKLNAGEKGRAP
ncbi:hypothetical protein BPOR_0611g00030 [Botrytis porri]|uniref:Uncharacterized protein n=1 Tax=Botrytis porri TaxID=87229 RepID=A0A4Z1KHD6_9HELO|nr:hypothetical protein BPOR_0611g00030 [Botrytis porri]